MARPTSEGLDYFPLDCTFDDEMELIEAKHGAEGFRIIIKLWQLIYGNKGYFYPWTEREQLLLSKRVNLDINTVLAVVNDAIIYKLFDKDRAEKHVLTSHGIQKRFIQGASRRNIIPVYDDIFMLKNEEIEQISDKCSHKLQLRGSYCNINDHSEVVFVDIGTQSKVKESKVKESKVKESSGSNNDDSAVPKTTPPFSLLKNSAREVGYTIDDKIAEKFALSNIPDAWLVGSDSFFAFAKCNIDEKYKTQSSSEKRVLFIDAVQNWENLREEYPEWKVAQEKQAKTFEVKQAFDKKPTHCEICKVELTFDTSEPMCPKCGGFYEFNRIGGVYVFNERLELNSKSLMESLRKKQLEPVGLPDF